MGKKADESGIGLEDLNKIDDIKPHINPDARDEEEANKGNVKVKKEDGKWKKKELIASLGLSSQMLPPVTRRKTAIYQAIGLHQIDPLSGQPVTDQSISIPGSIVVYDPFQEDLAKRNVKVRNVRGVHTEIVNGKTELRERVDDIFFNNGFIDVNIEREYPLYVLLELHPLNGSNRFRDKSSPAAFIRIDMNHKSTAFKNAEMDLAFDAEKTVLNLPKDDLIAYANTAGIITMGQQTDEIRYNFRKYARQNPKAFFGLYKDSAAAVRMNVLDADSMGLIDYVAEKKGYIFNSQPEKCFFTHAPGEDPMTALIEFFAKKKDKNAGDCYELLLTQLNFWEE